MHKTVKIVLGSIILVYFFLFFTYKNGYYERLNQEKTIMTDEMILKYEEDLANGVDVTKNDYTILKADYTNPYTETSLKISKKVENVVDSAIKFLFRKLNEAVDEEENN